MIALAFLRLLRLEAEQAGGNRAHGFRHGATLLHQGRASTVSTEVIGEYWIVVSQASMLGRHNPPPTDIPDEDQAAVPLTHDDFGGIELGAGRCDFTDVRFQSPQQRRWRSEIDRRRSPFGQLSIQLHHSQFCDRCSCVR